MRSTRHRAVVGSLLLLLVSCGPTRALEQLRGHVLFYPWTHGSGLPPEDVARLREEKVRSLREIEDFAGTLAAWDERTHPVERLRIGPDDLVLSSHLFVYYLASLKHPAAAPKLMLRVQRLGPDGQEVWDHQESPVSWMNRHAQAGGLLFSMYGLAPGEHRLHLEFRDRDRVAASGEIWIDYHPGESPSATEGASPVT